MKKLLLFLTFALVIGCDTTAPAGDLVGGVCKLSGVSPNPVVENVGSLSYQVETDQEILISVFDSTGRLRAILVQGFVSAGTHRDSFDLPFASGTYTIVMNGLCEGGSPTSQFTIID